MTKCTFSFVSFYLFLLKHIFFYNVVLVSAVQWSVSAVSIHISPPLCTFLLPPPSHVPSSSQNTELSPPCYIAASHELAVVYMVVCVCVCVCSVVQLCLTLCKPMDGSPPGSSVHGIFQATILGQVAISSSRGSSWPRDQTHISCISCTGRRIFFHTPPEDPVYVCQC